MSEFKLNEVEKKKANDFKQWHKRYRPKLHYALRQYAPFKYIFTTSGIVVLTSYVRIVEKLKISRILIVDK